MNRPSPKVQRGQSSLERQAADYHAKRRRRAMIGAAVKQRGDTDRERDEYERQIDHAVARNIEWNRRQYILNSPGRLADKLNLLHGDTHHG